MNLDNFTFGPLKDDLIETLTREFKDKNPYEEVYQVKEGDIVVDVGASSGIFTCSILDKKPKHVFCLEPSKNLFPYLVKNTVGYPVTQVNKAITDGNGVTDMNWGVYSDNGSIETITWNTFVTRFGIDKIDFLKLDCEGGEYDIFTDHSIHWLKGKVNTIVGEFHLGDNIQKEKFRHFRDNYLKGVELKIYSVDGVDITWDLWNEHFINYYTQVILHLNLKNDTSRI
jgi:FkbM family methyltransferase